MLYTIENEMLTCTIESKGAEIRSVKNKATGEEYIWQIDDTIWGSSSPVLFPAIGKIKEDRILYNGKAYAMPKHGIIRNNDQLSFERQGVASCAFTLTSSKETLHQYPFKFTFSIEYALIEKRLLMTYKVVNRDTIPMQFACGGHTAYACPLSENIHLSDYVIEFAKPLNLEANVLAVSGLLSDHRRKINSNKGILPLSDTLFDDDALVFANIACDSVRLRKKSDTKGIVVNFKDYPHLALWSKPSADFVCIEPWLGLPDREDEAIELTKKTDYKTIEPGAEFSIAIETEIEY
ncbi:aldose 1-epimerase family protein [Aquimarina intermedia]|uniref:Galactose mutarotase-like enzyme n=1 Tax=Aquimarina intermedia TaxID=350814 RepID=A0A5S5BX45_9FLAO|nr:aldose 1-epimerase family protein [Aquimarina intermedia]TYP71607.1 galactose mutarotase-like enzyme [Aquimarina intermedia]